MLHRRYRGVVQIMAALALLTLSLAGCGAGSAGGQTQPHATATPVKPLSWQVISLPGGAGIGGTTGFAVSPANGRAAWACEQGSGASFIFWRSQDAAATWSQVSTLTPKAPLPITNCTLLADQNTADGVAAIFTWGSGEAGTLASKSYYSSDGGQHWTRLPGSMQLLQVATVGHSTYALLHDTAATSPTNPALGLVSSADDLNTWQSVGPTALASNDGVAQFWVAPNTADELLAATNDGLLFHSQNAGAQWTAIPSSQQSGQHAQVQLAQWQPQQHDWLYCAPPDTPTDPMQCSASLGQWWAALPTLITTLGCSTCGKNGAPYFVTSGCIPDTIASDGAYLAICNANSATPSDSPAGSTILVLYRLAPHATAWAPLGVAPGPFVALAQTGQFWCSDGQAGTFAYLSQLP